MPPSAALGFVAALAAGSAAVAAAQSGDADLITNLPGWTGAQNMYSGYVSCSLGGEGSVRPALPHRAPIPIAYRARACRSASPQSRAARAFFSAPK